MNEHPGFLAIQARIEPLRRSLLEHRVYELMTNLSALRIFMEHHVFAVWDFMSLLKSLQMRLTCVTVPWRPPQDPVAARFVNEIVLGEESDEDSRGGYAGHFTLYRDAMLGCGANIAPIDSVLSRLSEGNSLSTALASPNVPAAARNFVAATFETIESGNVAAIASAFTFGREDLLPDVFQRIVDHLSLEPSSGLEAFRYYLRRHIELDGDHHGPMAQRLMSSLCGDDPAKWRLAEQVAHQALTARLALWNGMAEAIEAERSLR